MIKQWMQFTIQMGIKIPFQYLLDRIVFAILPGNGRAPYVVCCQQFFCCLPDLERQTKRSLSYTPTLHVSPLHWYAQQFVRRVSGASLSKDENRHLMSSLEGWRIVLPNRLEIYRNSVEQFSYPFRSWYCQPLRWSWNHCGAGSNIYRKYLLYHLLPDQLQLRLLRIWPVKRKFSDRSSAY